MGDRSVRGPAARAPAGRPAGALAVLWGVALAGCDLTGDEPEAGRDIRTEAAPAGGGEEVEAAAAGETVAPGDSVGLLIRGRIRGDTVILEPIFRVPPPEPRPRREGPHRLRVADAQGTPLAETRFQAAAVADLPGDPEAHFSLVLPLSAGDAARLHAVSVSAHGLEGSRTARMTAEEARDALRREGAVEARARPDGRVRVRWDGDRFPWALVREAGPEAGSGPIVAFARAGEATVRTGTERLEVVLSDGVQSAARTVEVGR